MLHILLFEKWRDKNKSVILFLHGLDGNHDNKQLEKLEELGIKTIALSFDYRNCDAWDIIKDLKIDGVIGHSLGGYLAYYLSNFKKIPCLMFMPDFGKEMHDIQTLPKDVLDLPAYKDKIAVIGSEDEDVDIVKNEEILKNVKTYEVKSDHMPSIKIFGKYCKIFRKLI